METETLDLWYSRILSAPSCLHIQRLWRMHCCQVVSQSPHQPSGGALLYLRLGSIHRRGRVPPCNTPHWCGSVWRPGALQSSMRGKWYLCSLGGWGGDLDKGGKIKTRVLLNCTRSTGMLTIRLWSSWAGISIRSLWVLGYLCVSMLFIQMLAKGWCFVSSVMLLILCWMQFANLEPRKLTAAAEDHTRNHSC